MTANGQQPAIELETFLRHQDETDGNHYTGPLVIQKRQDRSSEYFNHDGVRRWDPFKERRSQANTTTNCDTLTHLLKAALGTGILSMPIAFKYSGLALGIVATIIASVICTHCSYIVVKCAHELYHRTRVSVMSFADVGEAAFATGPQWGRKFSKLARISINGGTIAAYFGACSVYSVFIAQNLKKVLEHYLNKELNIRICIASLWIPLVLLCWVPNLKKLAPISMAANALMAIGLLITFYFLVFDLHPISEMPLVGSLRALPQFFSIAIFGLEVVGVVMPLENAMKTPQKFLGICGVFNVGLGGVTLLFILLGFLGYLKYGEDVKDIITLNLPNDSIPAQIVKICVALSVYCTYGVQYFVLLEIVWNGVKNKFKKHPLLAEYAVRTFLTSSTVLLAIAIPRLEPFIALIGALCFSFLGLIIPVFVELITYWDKGFGACYWLMWKNIFLFLFGMLAMFSGSYTSILAIIKLYNEPQHDEPVLATTTVSSVTQLLKDVIDSSTNPSTDLPT